MRGWRERGRVAFVHNPERPAERASGISPKLCGRSPHTSPSFPICRSQVDIEVEGDWRELLKEMRGFHWMMAYGDYLREIGYALSKIGIKWKVI